MSDVKHISDEKLDHLIRIQDMLRCQMTSVLATDDGFSEGNVHAGVYRALVELKELRSSLAAADALLREARSEVEHWTPDEAFADAHETVDLYRWFSLRDDIDAHLAAAREGEKVCQHNLQEPESTIRVIDTYTAQCSVCDVVFVIPVVTAAREGEKV
jgi:hypothetical protein